ncbi:hypothetical protein DFH07DRAFT_855546 [Mycena maculata]|uniref:Uncharacterized protein n=1 Tax=Mycena maculata TaxID=230809 RepID=A0AAD7HM08_9AGAR|nr:hypothetical protein DFH07DRAFT_855546 [Mycena maculata]
MNTVRFSWTCSGRGSARDVRPGQSRDVIITYGSTRDYSTHPHVVLIVFSTYLVIQSSIVGLSCHQLCFISSMEPPKKSDDSEMSSQPLVLPSPAASPHVSESPLQNSTGTMRQDPMLCIKLKGCKRVHRLFARTCALHDGIDILTPVKPVSPNTVHHPHFRPSKGLSVYMIRNATYTLGDCRSRRPCTVSPIG